MSKHIEAKREFIGTKPHCKGFTILVVDCPFCKKEHFHRVAHHIKDSITRWSRCDPFEYAGWEYTINRKD